MRIKKINFLLIFILLGAFLVRMWGIHFGLPYTYFVDEGYLIYWAFYSGSHALRPPYYLYAPFIPTILLGEFAIYYIGGYLLGVFSTPSQFFISYLVDPTTLFLIGRVTMSLAGVATVWLVFIVGKTFFSKRIGLIASFFLAFTFLHAKESHYIKQDVLMGFFVLASFYFMLKIVQTGKLREYLFSGISFAFAFGAKYQAILLLPIILFAHILGAKKHALQKLVLCGGISILTFCLIHPYVVIDLKGTLAKTLLPAIGSTVLYPEHLQGKSVWWWFMFEHIPQGIGYPFFIAGMCGFALCFWYASRIKRGAKQKKNYLFVPLLPILFFATIDFFTKMHFARYAVITLPFFALGGAIFIDFITNLIVNENVRKTVLIVLLVAFIFPSFVRIIQFDYLLTQSDTRTLAKEWFEKNIPAGAKVLVESTAKPEHSSNLNTPLNLDEKAIQKRVQDAESRGLDALYLRSLAQANKNKTGYDIIATSQVSFKLNIFTDENTRLTNVGYYVDKDVEYIVLTSWVQEKMRPDFTKSFYAHYQRIKEFRPTYQFKEDPHLIKVDYQTLDAVNILRNNTIFGPVIVIFKLKSV